MTVYAAKYSIGFQWNSDGDCYAVKLRRRGKSIDLVGFWHGQSTRDSGVGGCLSEGFASLNPNDGDVVVGSGDCCCGAFVDLHLPKLPPADLGNALKYELLKHAPLPEEALIWGYRVIAELPGQRLHVRLIYMREMLWSKWLDEVGASAIRADLIIPAPAVIDPLLATADLFIADSSGDHGFLFRHDPVLGRQVLRDDGNSDAVGSMPKPLAGLGIDVSALQAYSPRRQQLFLPALLLALHGLRREVAGDRRTWAALPYMLRPRRHRFSRSLAAVLVLYVLSVAAFGGMRWYSAAQARLHSLQRAHAQIETQIEALQRQPDPRQYVQTVQGELKNAYFERPSLAAALLELTRLINDQMWMPNFTWQDGRIEVQLQTQDDDTNLLPALLDSPILIDIVPTHKSTNNNLTTIRLQMHASFAAGRSQGQEADLGQADQSQADQGKEPQPR